MATRLVRGWPARSRAARRLARGADVADRAGRRGPPGRAGAGGRCRRFAGATTRGEAALPDDPGVAEAITQPASITRFAAATFTWRGGSNAVDNPAVRVERLVTEGKAKGTWQPFAGQQGEVQTFFEFGTAEEMVDSVVGAHATGRESVWTANFEAFDAFPARLPSVPDGQYRFVVDGRRRQGGATVPYRVTSAAFAVTPWTGIEPHDVRIEPDGSTSFAVKPIRYPRTYTPDPVIRFIGDDGDPTLCKTCTFRPWARSAEVAQAAVTVVGADGRPVRTAAATLRTTDGRWYAATALAAGERVRIDAGAVRDTFGEINGTATPEVTR